MEEESEQCKGFERFSFRSSLLINFLRWSERDSDENSVCRTDEIFDTVFVSLFNID